MIRLGASCGHTAGLALTHYHRPGCITFSTASCAAVAACLYRPVRVPTVLLAYCLFNAWLKRQPTHPDKDRWSMAYTGLLGMFAGGYLASYWTSLLATWPSCRTPMGSPSELTVPPQLACRSPTGVPVEYAENSTGPALHRQSQANTTDKSFIQRTLSQPMAQHLHHTQRRQQHHDTDMEGALFTLQVF